MGVLGILPQRSFKKQQEKIHSVFSEYSMANRYDILTVQQKQTENSDELTIFI